MYTENQYISTDSSLESIQGSLVPVVGMQKKNMGGEYFGYFEKLKTSLKWNGLIESSQLILMYLQK